MKKFFAFVLMPTLILIVACNNPKTNSTVNPYAGAWEMIYAKYVYPDTTYETTRFDNPTVKLLTDKHYAFGRQNGENMISGGGGEYSFEGDKFISYPKYHANSSMVGKSISFNSKIEGDLWTISFVVNVDTIKVEGLETWKRIVE